MQTMQSFRGWIQRQGFVRIFQYYGHSTINDCERSIGGSVLGIRVAHGQAFALDLLLVLGARMRGETDKLKATSRSHSRRRAMRRTLGRRKIAQKPSCCLVAFCRSLCLPINQRKHTKPSEGYFQTHYRHLN